MWTVQYNANELPDVATPEWTKTGDAATIEISPAGYLHVVSSTTGLSYLITDNNLSNTTGMAMETRLKVISGAVDDYPNWVNGVSNIEIMINGIGRVAFLIFSNAIRAYPSGNQYVMDTTDNYHTYRYTFKDSVVKLYIDGILRFTETNLNTTANNYVLFEPEINGGANIETSWDYVYYRTDGAFKPGEGVSLYFDDN